MLPPAVSAHRRLVSPDILARYERGEPVKAAVEVLEIPERALIAAADALGVRTQHGHWWLPG